MVSGYHYELVLKFIILNVRTKPLRTGIAQNTELINAGQQKLDGKKIIELRGEHNHDIATGTPDARLVLKNIRFERI